MSSCLAAGMYNMIADVWIKVTVLDEETNESVSSWKLDQVAIPCIAEPYLAGGARMQGMSETFAKLYANNDYLRIKTSNKLNKRCRVANIRNKKNELIYYESEGVGTVYNVDGSAPIINPVMDKPDEWLSTLVRAEVQG